MHAEKHTVPPSAEGGAKAERGSLLTRIGPGFITGAADDDPSGIGTYSIAGAQFGYGLLWLTPICVPLMIVVQEMCGRLAAITGQGLAAVLKEHYPRWILYGVVLLLFGANTINVWADLNVMAASAQMLFGMPFWLWLTLITAATLLLEVFIPYRTYVRYLKWFCLALGAYVVTALLPGVKVDWAEVGRNVIRPHWSSNTAFIMTIVGFLGTTISPYLFFWQAGETVEEQVEEGALKEPGRRLRRVTENEIRRVRVDTAVGMFVSQVITFFIIVTTASTLHRWHLTDLNTAQDAAKALLPLGKGAYWLFTIGMLGTGLLAIPTLAGSVAYAVSETMGWRYGLYRRYGRARGFYLSMAVVILLAYAMNFVHAISPVKGLLYTAVLNGIVAPPLIVLLLLMCNNRKVVGDRTNPAWVDALGWLTVALMTGAAGYLIWAMAAGKAS